MRPSRMKRFPTLTRMEKNSAIEMVRPTPSAGTVAKAKARTMTAKSNSLRASNEILRRIVDMEAPFGRDNSVSAAAGAGSEFPAPEHTVYSSGEGDRT
jgi:hypothetical protein